MLFKFGTHNRLVKRILLGFSLSLLIISSTGLYFSIVRHSHKQLPPVTIEQTIEPGVPKRILIPAIDLAANIQQLGVNHKGEMDVPTDAYEAGWYSLGTRPGVPGSAVIAGHYDTKEGEEGVFARIKDLQAGDVISVEDEHGLSTNFKVLGYRTYNPGRADEVFNLNDTAHLNLITCGGVWSQEKNSYSKRIVVFSELIE